MRDTSMIGPAPEGIVSLVNMAAPGCNISDFTVAGQGIWLFLADSFTHSFTLRQTVR